VRLPVRSQLVFNRFICCNRHLKSIYDDCAMTASAIQDTIRN
jgi:hypothetical protein